MMRPAAAIAWCGPAGCWDRISTATRPPKAAGWPPRRSRSAHDSVDLARYGFDRFLSARPAGATAANPGVVGGQGGAAAAAPIPRTVGGVDVSIARPDEGVAAYALVELKSGQLLWSTTVRRTVSFPYITSYLSFRELPILMELLGEVRRSGNLPRYCWSMAAEFSTIAMRASPAILASSPICPPSA